ncbi:ABC transporter ATP-binding protein [Conexibacter arvalis]|uniref:ABC-type nitrate/sulfonate/bicarbonate transport system ATPase subunit n=1 Tax=Conexibacter arvalis TaxID=912552 RepID=A0A840IBG3_9ACTN|nr:ABC transporter ATP-binding protein [Conexibacter arvalis]MBB4662176.1 ABC-type nitrate/sulfonate/bicarbonate transport system ATPase subunit [Conexibacter arvalis]
MGAIQIDRVTKVYNADRRDVLALDDVSLTIPDGEFGCIVGGSGCGKSTLLNVIAGLEPPTEGAALVGGRPVTGPGPDRGMVFQSYTLYPWLRVRENVEFGPSLAGTPAKERHGQSDELLAQMGLSEFADAYPSELSGGMQQRVAIVRAIANDPDVLLMDEPFGALDALTRSGAQRFLTNLWEQRRRTIAFVTHDIDEAVFLADRVYVMSPRPGRLRKEVVIDLPRSRDPEVLTTPEFADYKREILELIHETAAETRA